MAFLVTSRSIHIKHITYDSNLLSWCMEIAYIIEALSVYMGDFLVDLPGKSCTK